MSAASSSKRLLLFEFWNAVNNLNLSLIIGPGDSTIRQRIYDMANKNVNLFTKANRKLTPQWFTIYSKKILSQNDYEDANIEVLRPKIEGKWRTFLSDDFAKLIEYVQKEVLSD